MSDKTLVLLYIAGLCVIFGIAAIATFAPIPIGDHFPLAVPLATPRSG